MTEHILLNFCLFSFLSFLAHVCKPAKFPISSSQRWWSGILILYGFLKRSNLLVCLGASECHTLDQRHLFSSFSLQTLPRHQPPNHRPCWMEGPGSVNVPVCDADSASKAWNSEVAVVEEGSHLIRLRLFPFSWSMCQSWRWIDFSPGQPKHVI